jgi:hypothetical protein
VDISGQVPQERRGTPPNRLSRAWISLGNTVLIRQLANSYPPRMDIEKMLAELRAERENLEQAINSPWSAWQPALRRVDLRVLGSRQADVCRADSERVHTSSTRAIAPAVPGLETSGCSFANLPEARAGRWGEGLTAAKMENCRWLKPLLVGQFEFLEWTPDKHLRHSRFVRLIEKKRPYGVAGVGG